MLREVLRGAWCAARHDGLRTKRAKGNMTKRIFTAELKPRLPKPFRGLHRAVRTQVASEAPPTSNSRSVYCFAGGPSFLVLEGWGFRLCLHFTRTIRVWCPLRKIPTLRERREGWATRNCKCLTSTANRPALAFRGASAPAQLVEKIHQKSGFNRFRFVSWQGRTHQRDQRIW
jgi:hypothetical protein